MIYFLGSERVKREKDTNMNDFGDRKNSRDLSSFVPGNETAIA